MIPVQLFLDAQTGAIYEVHLVQPSPDIVSKEKRCIACTCPEPWIEDECVPCDHVWRVAYDLGTDTRTNEPTLTLGECRQTISCSGTPEEIRAWLIRHAPIEVM